VAKLTILTQKIAIQLHPVAESCTICSSRSRRPVWKLLDTAAQPSAHAIVFRGPCFSRQLLFGPIRRPWRESEACCLPPGAGLWCLSFLTPPPPPPPSTREKVSGRSSFTFPSAYFPLLTLLYSFLSFVPYFSHVL
jgi:hypothetical protein